MAGSFPLRADDVSSLKALGAFEEIKLHGLALVERAVPVFLDRGEMYEHILPRGALDKPVSFCSIEPLYSALLSHGQLLSPLNCDLILSHPSRSPSNLPPLKGRGR